MKNTDSESVKALTPNKWSYAGGIAGYLGDSKSIEIIGCDVVENSEVSGFIAGGIVGYRKVISDTTAQFIIDDYEIII